MSWVILILLTFIPEPPVWGHARLDDAVGWLAWNFVTARVQEKELLQEHRFESAQSVCVSMRITNLQQRRAVTPSRDPAGFETC